MSRPLAHLTRFLVTLALPLALLAGCGGRHTVRGTVTYPAAMPVRAFPRIWVAGGHLDHEIQVRGALAQHLRRAGRVEVRELHVDDLEPMRRAGEIPAATVVVLLELDFEERTRPEWTSRPETVCGSMGCYTSSRSQVYDVPTVAGRLSLTMYEGPTARILLRRSLQAHDEGRVYDDMRRRVVRRLIREACDLVDARQDRVKVYLLDVKEVEGVSRAIELIQAGRWHEGRQLLERASKSEAVDVLPPPDRARLYYDLSLARRFDPETMEDPEAHFAAAERALVRAIELDARDIYHDALRSLRQHRKQLETLRLQREAAEHNFALGHGVPTGVPRPPAGYGEASAADPPPAPVR